MDILVDTVVWDSLTIIDCSGESIGKLNICTHIPFKLVLKSHWCFPFLMAFGLGNIKICNLCADIFLIKTSESWEWGVHQDTHKSWHTQSKWKMHRCS